MHGAFPPKPLNFELSHQIISGFCKDSSTSFEAGGCGIDSQGWVT
jgi:hypothetical protein